MNVDDILRAIPFLMLALTFSAGGATYYLDDNHGNDTLDGLSPETAWKTLQKASTVKYCAGDSLLLHRGSAFKGKLELADIAGTATSPVTIAAYGEGVSFPRIDSAGYIAGVAIEGCKYVEMSDLEISSDGGKEIEPAAKIDRIGAYVYAESTHITLRQLYLHDIYATIQTKSEGKDNTTAYGHGVRLSGASGVTISDCRVEKVGRYGINAIKSQDVQVISNCTDNTGCSGLQMSRCKDVLVKGNEFNHPGSFIDQRMHGRGSGSWMWSCESVLYENNSFMNAKGKADSCGIHIDFNNSNIVIQYCFSMNNEGGFIEILGNCHNCAYRYNISVNDGSREKGKNGAHQSGKTLWLSGFDGRKRPQTGPFNSYIYNNTVYVGAGITPAFDIAPCARGILIANNIFYMENNATAAKKKKPGGNVVFRNNLYRSDLTIARGLSITDTNPVIANPEFQKPGGKAPKDYIPLNAKAVQDKGIEITNIPGDDAGLIESGLPVEKDFFGNPIRGIPDIGAVELTR